MTQLELDLVDGSVDGSVDEPAPSTRPLPTVRPRLRGFAAMDPERVREIASKGGRAAHSQGRAHRFTTEEARVAGRKGGTAPHVRRGRNGRGS